jgi:competence protein ComEC
MKQVETGHTALYLRPIMPLTLALIGGIVIGERLPGYALAAAPILVVAAAFLVAGLRRGCPVRWSALLALLAAGYLAMLPWMSPARGPDRIAGFLDTGAWQVHGTVVDPPRAHHGRLRMVVETATLSRGTREHAVRGRIRLTVMGESPLAQGDRIAFSAKLKPFRNFRNPGGFDYRRYMAFKGIQGSAWVRAERLQQFGRRPVSPFNRLIQGARRHLARLIDGAASTDADPGKAVLKALVFGDRSGIDQELQERFNRAGAGHLLAISGLHVGIVAGVAFAGLRWLAGYIPFIVWRGWGRAWAAAAALLPVAAYGALAGMSPSTQRAVIMVTVFLAAVVLGRDHDTLNTLAAAALAILAVFPPALFSISFQLSFAAVLAIVYGLARIDLARPDRPSRRGRIEQRLKAFVLVSALAIAGTTPVTLYHFNQTSLVGIVANLFLVPLVGFLVVPLGLVSAVAASFCDLLASLGFRLCIGLLRLALAGVDCFGGMPFAAVQTVTPSLIEIGLYYLAAWALLNLGRTTAARWVLSLSVALAGGDAIYWSYQRFWRPDLKVTAIDVGQGSATLLELPGGDVVLMDGGGYADNRQFDMGRLVVAPVLWRKKIASVDVLILSHPNADHLNGLIYIARHFRVHELWTNGDVNTTCGYADLMAACRETGVVVRTMDSRSGAVDFGQTALTVLHPPPGFFGRAEQTGQETRNNGSLVIKAVHGQTAFLITGDIMAPAEKELVGRMGAELASTVLFAPHHGSRSSSSPDLIAAVQPQLVVISAGPGNRFGFPHDEVTDRFRAAGCRTLCTATHGAVVLRSDGRRVYLSAVSGAGLLE